MTTFSVGDGVTLFSGWGDFLVGDTIPIYAVVTAPGGSVVTSGRFTATFYYETPSGMTEGRVLLTYDPSICVEPGVCVFAGYFTIPSTAPQGPWVMTITGTDGSNVAATAYSWLNVGLIAYTYTDSPTYVLGNTIYIQSLILNPDTGSYLTTGSYMATVKDYSTAFPAGIVVGTVKLSYVGSDVWFASFTISPRDPAGFYRVVVTGSDGSGNDANGETLVRVAPLSLNVAVTLSPSTSLVTAYTVGISVSVTYPYSMPMKVGSVDAFLVVDGITYYAPLTYNSASRTFVGTLPVQARGLGPGSYPVYISAFDPLGNSGAASTTLLVVST